MKSHSIDQACKVPSWKPSAITTASQGRLLMNESKDARGSGNGKGCVSESRGQAGRG